MCYYPRLSCRDGSLETYSIGENLQIQLHKSNNPTISRCPHGRKNHINIQALVKETNTVLERGRSVWTGPIWSIYQKGYLRAAVLAVRYSVETLGPFLAAKAYWRNPLPFGVNGWSSRTTCLSHTLVGLVRIRKVAVQSNLGVFHRAEMPVVLWQWMQGLCYTSHFKQNEIGSRIKINYFVCINHMQCAKNVLVHILTDLNTRHILEIRQSEALLNSVFILNNILNDILFMNRYCGTNIEITTSCICNFEVTRKVHINMPVPVIALDRVYCFFFMSAIL